jgi:hypothetical protein
MALGRKEGIAMAAEAVAGLKTENNRLAASHQCPPNTVTQTIVPTDNGATV